MCESQPFAHWCTAQKSFMIASTEGEMDMFRRSPKFLLHLTKEEYDLIVYSMINMGSVKNVGVEDTPRISEPLSFFEKTLFSSAPTGVSHR